MIRLKKLKLDSSSYSNLIRRTGGRRGIENVLARDGKEEDYEITELAEKANKTCLGDSCGEADQDEIHVGGELEEVERPPWTILSNDIVELIASYLNPKDYAQFRSVCRRNRSIFPEVYPPRAILFPLLVFHSFEDNTGTIYNFVDPMRNEKYSMKKNLSELLAGATIRYSKYGWLLLVSQDMKTPFFYNPFTKVMIRLPDFPDTKCRLYLSGMSFSSKPTSPDCVVFAIEQPHLGIPFSIYALKRGSCDRRSHVFHGFILPCFNNPVFFQGDFVCLDYTGTLGRCVLNDEDNNDGLDWGVDSKPSKQFNETSSSYLVECNGNLLLVNVGPLGETVGVYSLDLAAKVWVEVKNLGKHMLFISNTSSFSAVAPPNSRMENKVYFPRLHKDGRGLLFYSLDTGMYHYSSRGSRAEENHIDVVTDFYDTKEMTSSSWIEPDWSQSTTTAEPNHFYRSA
ncbi:F-box/kelch-repeat protein At1g57790-like isoform X1 [Papaver somniferum]|uniref:F-box/kelch-repeat protein At1g57790-like isoform X1 n=1 Tax=Papaver somniferum TaxID=3469 RepID=UPI000E6F8510|nr:F-box/kelch-repeat protein At1g57790-like isoform X1 [Papaver somniferum]